MATVGIFPVCMLWNLMRFACVVHGPGGAQALLTFSMYVWLGRPLTAPVVFTSLALFNVLTAPLNSFPWVVNGCIEAVVSVRRLQR